MSLADFFLGIWMGVSISSAVGFGVAVHRDRAKCRQADHDHRIRQIIREELGRAS